MPPEMLNSPRNASTGIVSPSTARAVRVGRVIRFCQAKDHMTTTNYDGLLNGRTSSSIAILSQ